MECADGGDVEFAEFFNETSGFVGVTAGWWIECTLESCGGSHVSVCWLIVSKVGSDYYCYLLERHSITLSILARLHLAVYDSSIISFPINVMNFSAESRFSDGWE